MRIKTVLIGLVLVLLLMPATVYGSQASNMAHLQLEQFSRPEPVATLVTIAEMNLRPGPCTSYPRITRVPMGREVNIIDFRCGEWFAVEFEGYFGYLYSAYLINPPNFASLLPGRVEIIDWQEVRHIITPGEAFKVIDARTGFYFHMSAISDAFLHADVETITPEDTDTMFRVFGGQWSWDTRPVLALIGGRVFAASINGMPHSIDTRPGNGKDGHVCMHFPGSLVHNSYIVHQGHQDAIMEAYAIASSL